MQPLRVAARHAMHAGAKQANARTTAQRVQPGHLIAAAHLDIVAALERTSALGLSTSLGEPDRNSHRTSPARCPGGQEQAQRWPVLRTSRARVRTGLQPAGCPWVSCPSFKSAEAEGKTRSKSSPSKNSWAGGWAQHMPMACAGAAADRARESYRVPRRRATLLRRATLRRRATTIAMRCVRPRVPPHATCAAPPCAHREGRVMIQQQSKFFPFRDRMSRRGTNVEKPLSCLI